MIQNIIEKLFGKKHDFDLENPHVDAIEIIETHSINDKKLIKSFTEYGWECKKCNKIYWLDKNQMLDLPRKMKYGCGDK